MQASIRRKLPILGRIPIPSSPQGALFHSTPITCAKGKNKAYIRYAVRQKRADAKKALKDYFVYGRSTYFKDDEYNSAGDNSNDDAKTQSRNPWFSKLNGSPNSRRGKHKSWRHKQQYYDIDDDDVPQNIFHATFGGQKCYNWSFTWTENFSFDKRAGFSFGGESRWERDWGSEWKQQRDWRREWSESESEGDEDKVSSPLGFRSQRITLGLSPTGPLKLEDVKSAFRASALKWHPDKHQGPSQAMAEEKFKHCVNAYNCLCNALKPTRA